MASENFRHFSGKKPIYIKEYGHIKIPKSERADTLNLHLYHIVFLRNKFIQSRTEPKFLREKREDLLFVLTSLIKCDDVIIYYT